MVSTRAHHTVYALTREYCAKKLTCSDATLTQFILLVIKLPRVAALQRIHVQSVQLEVNAELVIVFKGKSNRCSFDPAPAYIHEWSPRESIQLLVVLPFPYKVLCRWKNVAIEERSTMIYCMGRIKLNVEDAVHHLVTSGSKSHKVFAFSNQQSGLIQRQDAKQSVKVTG